MMSSVCSLEENQGVVFKSESMVDEEDVLQQPYVVPTRSNIARHYSREDDNSMSTSPTVSEILDADEDEDAIEGTYNGEDSSRTEFDDKNSEDNEDEEEDEWGIIDDPVFEQRIYDSPRLFTDDNEIFPSKDTRAFLCKDDRQRWEQISIQAGPHRVDGSSLMIRRTMSPLAIKYGMVAQYAASRVRMICLWLDHKEDILPQWLDIIATLFTNLEHFSILQDTFEGEEEIEVSARMRRLYVLYRLPDLKSIDGTPVTRAERAMARPSSPNGERVPRNDWVDKKSKSSLLDDDDEDEDDDYMDGSVANESIGNETATELRVDLAQLTAKISTVQDSTNNDIHDHRHNQSMDDDESLDGEKIVDLINAVTLSHSGEEREDLCSNSRDESDQHSIRPAPAYSQHSRSGALHEVATADTIDTAPIRTVFSSCKRKSISAPSRTSKTREQSDVHNVKSSRTSQVQRTVLSQSNTIDTLELVSVVSSHHEWTAACGVLSFHRSDHSCAPRLRLNFCGRGNRKRITENNNESNNESSRPINKHISRAQMKPKGNTTFTTSAPLLQLRSRTPSARGPFDDKASNDFGTRSPLHDRYTNTSLDQSMLNTEENVDTSAATENQKLPPSKSLSSPFPMQFRERTSSLRISTAETELTVNKPELNIFPSSPRARGSVPMDTITQPITLTMLGTTSPPRKKSVANCRKAMGISMKHGLPPPCPGTVRRKVVAASLLQRVPDPREQKEARRARRMERRKRAFQETARSTSVLDDLDDDTEDDSSCSSEEEDMVDRESLACEYDYIHEGNEW